MNTVQRKIRNWFS